uniref:Cyclic nucleotide-binding domain-containing protein n=1 Tax=Angiostrongylus cantonensis TaxID=6313 RepID=A0A0K0D0M1_ANGCA
MEDLLAPARVTRRSTGLQVVQMCIFRDLILLATFIKCRKTSDVNRYAQWTVLTKSPLFKSCEVSFLKDVVAYLKPRDFGPGEVVCARGELNREMFVVASGYLEIVDHNNVTLKTFCEGDIVEDKSLLWFPNNCYENRKKYDVISIGYSQVYILFRDDLLRVLSDYPQCRESVRTQAELMQREAGELFDEAVTTEIDDFEGSSLEERLISIRSVLSALESSVNVSYENFKVFEAALHAESSEVEHRSNEIDLAKLKT